MDRRAATKAVARNIGSVIEAAGSNPLSVTRATDVAGESLNGNQELSLDELVTIGGFFGVSPGSLLEVSA